MNEPVLMVRDLKRAFTQGGVTIKVLRGVNLSVARGEVICTFREDSFKVVHLTEVFQVIAKVRNLAEDTVIERLER